VHQRLQAFRAQFSALKVPHLHAASSRKRHRQEDSSPDKRARKQAEPVQGVEPLAATKRKKDEEQGVEQASSRGFRV